MRLVREHRRPNWRVAMNCCEPLSRVGEVLAETTKQRFQTSTAPDGTRWEPNAPATYENLLARFKGSVTRRGKLSAKGAARAAGKKPLIGETGALATQIFYRQSGDMVEIGSPMIYAAVHQFGAAAGAFGSTSRGAPIPWGDIPARPFLGLSADDEQFIIEIFGEYFSAAAGP